MWSKLLILSITLFIKECLTCSNDPQCTFGSKYLLVQMLDRINSPVSWYEAENYCKDVYGTHLASIHSEEDVANSIKTCKQAVGIDKCWIGLNDINNEGVWTYSDNTPVDITAWAPGEPTGDLVATTEDCVYISPEKGYGWNDFDCEGNFRNKIKVYSFLCNNPDYDPELECHCECDVCQIEGDPHITTFDKLLYHFMGECTYLYVTPCFNNYNTLPIEISGSHIQCFDNRGDRTCLDKVYVNLYDNNNEIAAQLKLGENYLAEWTGVGTLGWSGNAQLNEYITWSSNPTRQLYILKSITNVLDVQFYLYDTTDHEIMDARIQVARDYDPNGWGAFVNIWLAQCYAEESDVCGLCGHYDFNSLNDFAYVDDEGNLLTISTEGVSVVKSMTQDAWERTHLFGEKWINEELTEKEDCEVIGSPPDTECATVVEDFCKTFWDRECSCPYEYQEDYYSVTWFEGCVWDTCSLCADLDWSQTSYEEALHSGCFAFANITCYHQCREIETNTLQPTYQPTFRPTPRPTLWPTNNPTPRPTQRPTLWPTNNPTQRPTQRPTLWPTNNPTQRPTQRPTLWPTNNPTQRPTLRPTPNPTQRPTPNPTPRPTLNPTPRPTPRPTLNPTANPTPRPTPRPTLNPTPNPTPRPTPTPTLPPLEVPVNSETTESPDYWWHWVTQPKPTPKPTLRPTTTLPPIETQAVTTTAPPTLRPTYRPTLRPTYRPTNRPTPRPTYRPTNRPTPRPTYRPTNRPTPRPTNRPTPSPTLSTEPNAEPTDDYWYHWNKGSKKP